MSFFATARDMLLIFILLMIIILFVSIRSEVKQKGLKPIIQQLWSVENVNSDKNQLIGE